MKNLLDVPYPLSQEAIDFYQKNRYIKLKQVFDEETLAFYSQKISQIVRELHPDEVPFEQRDTYGRAFLQVMNLWRHNQDVRDFVLGKRLAKIAADLMQVAGVRLYHDQALYKEAGGGITPWHADQYYWPLSNDRTVTAWVPMQAVPLEMGPLEFSAGSHQIVEGREWAISDDSETQIQQRLRVTDFQHVVEPFDLGEVSFHSGWVFHRAGANRSSNVRRVMTVIYMDQDMVLKQPQNDNQINDWHTWCPGAQVDAVIDTPLNPVVYSSRNS
jgi:ectoine hydroxylase-related dioxygenase (phytanoyl-CoA dioxygenase family)